MNDLDGKNRIGLPQSPSHRVRHGTTQTRFRWKASQFLEEFQSPPEQAWRAKPHSQNNWLMVQILWKCEFLPLNAGLGTSKPRNGQLGPWNNVVYGTARGKKSVIAPQTLGYLSAWGL